MRKLFLKLDNQTYKLARGYAIIPASPKNFVHLKLAVSEYHRKFLDDKSPRLGSITLTPSAAFIAFRKKQLLQRTEDLATADVNEASLDLAVAIPQKKLQHIGYDLSKSSTLYLLAEQKKCTAEDQE